MNQKAKNSLLLLVSISTCMATMLLLPTVAQNPEYHRFADVRPFLGIANFFDVASNFFFAFFGIMGLKVIFLNKQNPSFFTLRYEAMVWKLFFLASILISLGSAYYHMNPTNHTLVWDRLPMTIAFMSFFSLLLMERVNEKAGFLLLPVLLLCGAASVLYWSYTESLGHGDLRPYLLVQFLPLALMPALFFFFPGRYTSIRYLAYALLWYILAKLLEHFDNRVFEYTGQLVSGHSLKHIAASFSIAAVALYLKRRALIPTKTEA